MSNLIRSLVLIAVPLTLILSCSRNPSSTSSRDSIDGEVLITNSPPAGFPTDRYWLDSITIDRNIVTLYIGYGGSNRSPGDEFRLILTQAASLKSFPAQANLYLTLDRHIESEATVYRVLSFDLRPVANQYELLFAHPDPIIINVHNLSESPPYSSFSVTYYPNSDD